MDPYILYAATLALLATHFVSSTPLRPLLAQAIGEKGYLGAYTLVAFATLGWMIWAYNRTAVEPLWEGLRIAPAVLMPFSFILLACGLLSRNPTLVGADKLLKSAEPARGIIRVTRHPVMWGFILWAFAHILARGEMKATVFFGAFLVLALDGLNPQVAARMARGFDRWKKFDDSRKAKSKLQLERIRGHAGLSRDVAEIVTKALA